MTSEKFRRQLHQEAQLWQAEGLIDEGIYQRLAQRYQFESIESAASNRFVMLLIGLGGVLLGLGIITFVAANWQRWSQELKIVLLLGLFVIVNVLGFYLWRSGSPNVKNSGTTLRNSISGRNQRLGEGLLIFGALSLGACLALMSQMFHSSGDAYELFLVWGGGVLAMAYGLRLRSLSVIAVLLIGWGYYRGIPGVFLGRQGSGLGLDFVIEHMALLSGAVFVPLAYWCESQVVFILSVILLVSGLEANSVRLEAWNLGLWVMVWLTLPPALLWGYDDRLLPGVTTQRFRSVARSLAIWGLSLVFFVGSFQGIWIVWSGVSSEDSISLSRWLLVDVLIFAGLTAWEWFQLAKPSPVRNRGWGFDTVTTVVAGLLIVTAVVGFWHLEVSPITTLATFIFNLQLFLLAAGLIRIGLAEGRRGAFWGGMVLLVLQILSRTVEYNTELMFKALVFVLCGVGVILAGLWYERHLRQATNSDY